MAIGEVIESTTAEFIAEARRYDQIPAYGSFVKVRDGNILVYGIVSEAYTGVWTVPARQRLFSNR